jgi:hypothetical protein
MKSLAAQVIGGGAISPMFTATWLGADLNRVEQRAG